MGGVIPLRDLIPARTTPLVNYAMIGICAVVWLLQVGNDSIVELFGMVPERVTGDGAREIPWKESVGLDASGTEQYVIRPMRPAAVPEWLTLLTCTFLHGGWLHFLGNMWFLWIFGDNVEDRLGHLGYLGFYLACGVVASGAHLLAGPDSPIPTVGASGAIAGVMGAYLHLYPRSQIIALVPLGIVMTTMVLPAPLFLLVWFGLQVFRGTIESAGPSGGVAWWAHIGGFAVGYLVALALGRTPMVRPPVTDRRSYQSRRATLGRWDRRL